MADEIKMNFDFSDIRARKKWLDAYIGKMVVRLVNLTTLALQKHIRVDLFGEYPGGTSAKTLSTRSGKLKKSVINIPAVKDGDVVYGGVAVGTTYGRVHFGKRGQVTTIVPKTAKALAIPLPAAMDSHGVAKGGPRDSAIFGMYDLFVIEKGKGPVLMGKLKYVKGKSAGKERGDIVPLFKLVKSVQVPARIHPEDLREFVQPLLGKGMADIRNGLMGSTALEGA